MELIVNTLTGSMANQVADLVRDHRTTRACASAVTTATFLEGRGGRRVTDVTWRMPLYHLSDRNTIVGRDLHHYMLVEVIPLPKDERLETKCRFRLSVSVAMNTIRQYANDGQVIEVPTVSLKEGESKGDGP